MPPSTDLKIIETIADIPEAQWNALAGNNPFLSHAFLRALQESGCASPRTGWKAQFLTLWQDNTLVGAMPLYLKNHSYGEFVFDWAWAEAYKNEGLNYYPKLLCAVPFTPATGLRLLATSTEIRAQLIRLALEMAQSSGVSSLHILFPYEDQVREMQQQGMMVRQGVQFHWRNPGYADFDAYLSGMSHDKRKRIKQERRKVRDAGITFERIRGKEITTEQWTFFFGCFTHTFRQYNSPQPLNLDFFRRIGASMPENILLIIASRNGEPIASALNFFNADALYGRSWGALEYHPGLHFETCYYQAIEFCIEQKIALFEGGAQGEHKIARGFLPETTWSAHWLAHPEFSRAVEDFLQREAKGMNQYVDELNDSNPFKQKPSE
ncbi:MAG: GNAT family N-acetyltransferase [Gammaproteobacteria bacterium]|nr:GNAT family N-acetyltransferase [Gammaproteobacteria bacterium]MBU1979310.1 GNAT family N-acetyltransferase [Gammaproteobacteria bacterium]